MVDISTKYILETERLRLRELTLADAPFIVELVNSPGWLKYIGNRNIKTIDPAKTYLENGPIKSYHENGFGLWLVETKDPNTPLGMCGILRRETLGHPDLGFAFLPEYIGRGYGFEVATATLAFAKDALTLPTLAGDDGCGNHSRRRCMLWEVLSDDDSRNCAAEETSDGTLDGFFG